MAHKQHVLLCPSDLETASSVFDPAGYDVNDCAGCGASKGEHAEAEALICDCGFVVSDWIPVRRDLALICPSCGAQVWPFPMFNFHFRNIRWSDHHRGWLIYFEDGSHRVANHEHPSKVRR